MPSTINRDSALGHLRMAVSMAGLTSQAGTVSPQVLKNITSHVEDAIDLLQQRDPVKRHMSMIILALQDSTEIRVAHTTSGEAVEHVYVRDRELYNWAVKNCHKLTEGKGPRP